MDSIINTIACMVAAIVIFKILNNIIEGKYYE